MAGFVGIGGGLFMNPLMLHMGLLALISSNTIIYLVLILSSAVCIQYAYLGLFNLQYSLYFGLIVVGVFFVVLRLVGQFQTTKKG